MANLSLAFDILARDKGASKTFKDVGNAAEKAGKQGHSAGSLIGNGLKVAAGAFLGAGLIEGFKELYTQAAESQRIGRLTNQVLKSTGGVAGVTAKQVSDLATAISKKTGVDDEAIQSGENLLLTFTNIRNEAGRGNKIFDQATQVITDMSVALGQDMKSSAIQVGKALNDPIKGVTALQRVGVSFTASQKEQIATLVESGRTLDAQKIILGELTREFGGAAAAAATPFDKLKVTLGNLAEEAGGALIPVVNKLANFLMDDLIPAAQGLAPVFSAGMAVLKVVVDVAGAALRIFTGLPAPVQAVVIALTAMKFLRGPLDGLFTSLSVKVTSFATGMGMAAKNTGGLKGAVSGLAGSISPVGAALSVATAYATKFLQGKADVQARMDAARDASETLSSALAQQGGQWNSTSRQAADAALQAAGLTRALRDMNVSSEVVNKALAGNARAFDDVISSLEKYDAQQLVTSDGADPIAVGLDVISGKARENADAFRELTGATSGYLLTAQVVGKLPQALLDWAAASGQATGAAAETQTAAEKSAEAIKAWKDELAGINDAFVDPLHTYEGLLQEKAQAEADAANKTAENTGAASKSWEDFAASTKISLSEYARQLEEQIKAHENWRTNLVLISERGGTEVAQILANMGEKGAGLVQQMVDANGADFERMKTDMIRESNLGGAGAASALDTHMKVMAAVGASGGKATAQAIAAQLGIGVADVERIAAQYGVKLAQGINPVLSALGRPNVHLSGLNGFNTGGGFAAGGYTGDGGKHEPKGVVHGGEFVFTKEQTRKAGVGALEVWAKMLDGYAGGGFVSTTQVPRPPSTAPYRIPISTAGDAAMGKEYAETVAFVAARAAALAATQTTAIGGVMGAPTSSSGNVGLVQAMAAARGWTGAQWNALYTLIMHESGFRNTAQNPTSTAYGMFQFLDSTWGSTGYGKTSDPRIQTLAGFNYIASRYGSPVGAWNFWSGHHWYDDGGWLPPGISLAYNGTGKPERVRTAEQEAALTGGGSFTGTLVLDSGEFMGKVHGVIRESKRQDAIADRRRYGR